MRTAALASHIGLDLSSIRTFGQTHWFAIPSVLEGEHVQVSHRRVGTTYVAGCS